MVDRYRDIQLGWVKKRRYRVCCESLYQRILKDACLFNIMLTVRLS
jgi:hypothetical protein